MKFEEVLPALIEGKKIRRSWWGKYHYIERKLTLIQRPIINERDETYILYLDDLEADDWEIVEEKKKVKLRDLTEEQYKKWGKNNCNMHSDCKGCLFEKVYCAADLPSCWIDHKDLYSDKFLDQEIRLEE